jgi:hypothetical protein
LDVKVDDEIGSLHVKRIGSEDLVGYVYIVKSRYIIKHHVKKGWFYIDRISTILKT